MAKDEKGDGRIGSVAISLVSIIGGGGMGGGSMRRAAYTEATVLVATEVSMGMGIAEVETEAMEWEAEVELEAVESNHLVSLVAVGLAVAVEWEAAA